MEGNAQQECLQNLCMGMGGQAGGMVNEAGHFPEVCKKSLQAMASDIQGGSAHFFETYSLPQLQAFSPRKLEASKAHDSVAAGGWLAILSPDRVGRRVAPHTPRSSEVLHRAESFGTSAAEARTKPAFCCSSWRGLYGTNNVNNCSYYCHQASGVGLTSSIGTARRLSRSRTSNRRISC